MRRRATLKDVAEAAGVHPGTVSRVLHPATRELVNAEATARIDEIIAELNYRLGHERIAHSPALRRCRTRANAGADSSPR